MNVRMSREVSRLRIFCDYYPDIPQCTVSMTNANDGVT
jgi:hypothetical protein